MGLEATCTCIVPFGILLIADLSENKTSKEFKRSSMFCACTYRFYRTPLLVPQRLAEIMHDICTCMYIFDINLRGVYCEYSPFPDAVLPTPMSINGHIFYIINSMKVTYNLSVFSSDP